MSAFVKWMQFANSAVNPFVFAFRDSEIRQTIYRLFRSCRRHQLYPNKRYLPFVNCSRPYWRVQHVIRMKEANSATRNWKPELKGSSVHEVKFSANMRELQKRRWLSSLEGSLGRCHVFTMFWPFFLIISMRFHSLQKRFQRIIVRAPITGWDFFCDFSKSECYDWWMLKKLKIVKNKTDELKFKI